MDLRYKLSFVIYSIVQILFVLYVLMWSLGMNVNNKLNPTHYLLITLIISNILLIGFLPRIATKQNLVKNMAKFFGFLFLAINLCFALKFLFEIFVYGLDGGFFTIVFLMLFAVADVYLIFRVIKL